MANRSRARRQGKGWDVKWNRSWEVSSPVEPVGLVALRKVNLPEDAPAPVLCSLCCAWLHGCMASHWAGPCSHWKFSAMLQEVVGLLQVVPSLLVAREATIGICMRTQQGNKVVAAGPPSSGCNRGYVPVALPHHTSPPRRTQWKTPSNRIPRLPHHLHHTAPHTPSRRSEMPRRAATTHDGALRHMTITYHPARVSLSLFCRANSECSRPG